VPERPERPGPEAVADAAWERVRELAGRAEALERLAAMDPDPDAELAMRLARARERNPRSPVASFSPAAGSFLGTVLFELDGREYVLRGRPAGMLQAAV